MLPPDRMLTHYPQAWPGEETVETVCMTDDRLKQELLEFARGRCGMRVVISPWFGPQFRLGMERLRKVEIYIKHYNAFRGLGGFGQMSVDMTRVVDQLRKLEYLNELIVRFQDDGSDEPDHHRGDSHWCRQLAIHGPHGRGEHIVLKTYFKGGPSIVENLLWPPTPLPRCEKVQILGPKGLSKLPVGAALDMCYIANFCRNLERWVQGRRGDGLFMRCRQRLEDLRERAKRAGHPYSDRRYDV